MASIRAAKPVKRLAIVVWSIGSKLLRNRRGGIVTSKFHLDDILPPPT
jgi:hypothetical protein